MLEQLDESDQKKKALEQDLEAAKEHCSRLEESNGQLEAQLQAAVGDVVETADKIKTLEDELRDAEKQLQKKVRLGRLCLSVSITSHFEV